MIIAAKKRTTFTKSARLRRSRVPLGDVRRNAAGEVEMIEFTEYVRDSHAPQILVNKIGGIYRLNNSIIKVTCVLESPGPGGIRTVIERGSFLWHIHDVMEANRECSWAFDEMRRGTFIAPDDDGGRRQRSQ
jgi:hypothetical protein